MMVKNLMVYKDKQLNKDYLMMLVMADYDDSNELFSDFDADLFGDVFGINKLELLEYHFYNVVLFEE